MGYMKCGNNKQCHVTLFVLVWHVEIDPGCFLTSYHHHKTHFCYSCSSIIFYLNKGYSHHQIQAKTGVGKGTVGSIPKEVENDKKINHAGSPSKLLTCDKVAIIWEIYSGRVDNAV